MTVILWDESDPSITQSAGLGEAKLRSIKTSVRAGLDTEHIWPSAGGDAGVHRLGSARAYVGAQSLVSSSGTDGRVMIASDTSRLFGVGSTGTVLLGAGPGSLSIGSGVVVPQRHHWVMEVGIGEFKVGSGSTTITYPNSGFSGIPFTQLTNLASVGGSNDLTNVISVMSSSNGGSLTVFGFNITTGLAASTGSFYWQSFGTRAL